MSEPTYPNGAGRMLGDKKSRALKTHASSFARPRSMPKFAALTKTQNMFENKEWSTETLTDKCSPTKKLEDSGEITSWRKLHQQDVDTLWWDLEQEDGKISSG